MSNYNADNMSRFLGSDCTNNDAEKFSTYLEDNGWTLEIPAGENKYHAYVEECGELCEMDEREWRTALAECFE